MFSFRINPEKVKHQNTSYLKSIGVDVIDHLPYIELNKFRSNEDVARRCLVMAALFQLSLGAPNEFIEDWLGENELLDCLTSHEQHLLSSPFKEISEQEQTDLYWVIEAVWALVWVGSKHNNLTFNTGVEDTLAGMLPSFQKNESGAQFIKKFKLRSTKEIFTKLDQFYRAHWYARNNQLVGKSNPVANIDLIIERRKALEWVCNQNVNWDQISLDT